jgi:hypothetical protein
MPLEYAPIFTRGTPSCLFGRNGHPFVIGQFIAHDSRPQFGSLNHGPTSDLKPACMPLLTSPALMVAFGAKQTGCCPYQSTCLSRYDTYS